MPNGATDLASPRCASVGLTKEEYMKKVLNERGATGWALLWLIGIPVPILVVLFLMRGCT